MADGSVKSSVLDDWMSRDDLAAELLVSVDTLARWEVRRLGPPCVRLGRRVYYRREAVQTWLVSQERPNVRGRK
jgi:hypothetical protein